jgi:hypothetical protein
MRFLSAFLLASTILVLSWPSLSYAEKKERPLTACDQSEELGSVFYDFVTMFIFYVGFMRSSDDPQFPDALKFDNFNANLVQAIKTNFALCLKTAEGKDKSIIVIPPHGQESTIDYREAMERIHNPRNLTLLITGNYFPQYEIARGVKGSGHIFSYWYRPDIPNKHYRLPIGFIGGVLKLPPLDGSRSIEERLETFFDNKRPQKVPTREEFRQGAGRINRK